MKHFSKQLYISSIIKGIMICSFLILGTTELVKAIGTVDDPVEPPTQSAPPPPPPVNIR